MYVTNKTEINFATTNYGPGHIIHVSDVSHARTWVYIVVVVGIVGVVGGVVAVALMAQN